jgi:drug/metabolite transporter (DMT)-like permease
MGRLGTFAVRSPVAAVVAGALCISTSAIVMRLAGSSATVDALFRCGLALPLLGVLAWMERRSGVEPLSPRARRLTRIGGALLAGDLVLWSHAIDAVGAGLATVLANIQVVVVGVLAWWLLGERPGRSLMCGLPIMFAGVVLVAGVGDRHPYGAHPWLGVLYGFASSVLYAGYILLLRHGTPRTNGHTSDAAAGTPRRSPAFMPLYEATLGATVAAAILALALGDFRIGPLWPALGWLAVLAVSSQVLGWSLIATSLPRLPAALASALLLVQPAAAVGLAALVFGEHPSISQLGGVALILLGVVVVASRRAAPDPLPSHDPRDENQAAVASSGST